MKKHYDLGNVVAVPEGTENPYTSTELFDERPTLLGRFLRGLETPGVEFWYAPAFGGAHKIESGVDAVSPSVVDYYWNEDGSPKVRPRLRAGGK